MKKTKALTLMLALSVAAAVGSLSWTSTVPAQALQTNSTGPGFSFISASAKIIHEPVDAVACGVNQDVLSCGGGVIKIPIQNVTQLPALVLGGIFSDSYEIDAALALDHGVDFSAALNQSIFLALNAGNCDSFQSVFNSTFFNVIPGNDIYVKQIGRWETFSFDGNVPGYVAGSRLVRSGDFSHVSLKGQSLSPSYAPYPHAPYGKMQPTTVFELTGNANLCDLEGPASFIIQLGVDGEPVCTDISPTYSTLDITQAFPFACGD